MLDEHPAFVGRRAFPAQIVDQRLPHHARQRQHGASTVLSGAYLQGAAAPVDVVQTQVGHLAGPQPQGRQALHDRLVPLPARGGGVERCEHLLDLLLRQGTRQRRKPPMGNGRESRIERVAAESLEAQEPEERPQR